MQRPRYERLVQSSLDFYYLAGIRHEGLVYSANADAFQHLHLQRVFFLKKGSAPVGQRSTKMITRFSFESKLCGAEKGTTYAVWYKFLPQGMGISVPETIKLYVDNN